LSWQARRHAVAQVAEVDARVDIRSEPRIRMAENHCATTSGAPARASNVAVVPRRSWKRSGRGKALCLRLGSTRPLPRRLRATLEAAQPGRSFGVAGCGGAWACLAARVAGIADALGRATTTAMLPCAATGWRRGSGATRGPAAAVDASRFERCLDHVGRRPTCLPHPLE
jgi:hypothetical protein